jgi:hypothetical protein
MLNKRKCKHCKEVFQKTQPLQFVCSPKCAIDYSKKEKVNKINKETREMKKALLTHKDYIKMLQVVFNTFIRTRDKDEACISCGTRNDVQYAAGHFYPTTYQYLRFNEDNVHKQCNKKCNMMQSGNLVEYRPQLEEKIGFDRLQTLHNNRHKRLELSIPEIKDLIKIYKEKTKALS